MSWLEALILGIVQGLTEFLPVSSSGHLEIGKALLGIEMSDDLLFTVVVHGATVLSTIVVFWKEIVRLFQGVFKFKMNEETTYVLKIFVSMIPVMIVGLFFKDYVESLIESLLLVGCMLLLTALLLTLATYLGTGKRDISYRELSLEFDSESHVWDLISDDCGEETQSCSRLIFLLSALLREQPELRAPAKTLLEKIDPDGVEGMTPNSFSHKLRKSVDALRRSGIVVTFRKSNGERLICLKRADGGDDPAAENTVTIVPAN